MTTAECFIFKSAMTGKTRDLGQKYEREVKNVKKEKKQNQKKLKAGVRKLVSSFLM